jgi:hypothetical protein
MLEFNRYGIRWDEFQQMIELLRQKNIKFRFQSTISNLTIHGHSEFLKYFGDDEIVTSLAYQPVMMSPWVLDPDSKEVISKQAVPRLIKDSIVSEPTEEQRADIRNFLIEFTRRRTDLSLSIFPESFLKWLGLHNVVQ